MQKGLLPIKRKDHRTYDFARTFGSVSPDVIPQEFSFDISGIFPDQNQEDMPQACTAYAENDIATNDDKLGYYDDQNFTYKNTKDLLGLKGQVPVDLMTALKAGTIYGVKKKSETPEQALTHRRSPYFIVKKLNGSYFDALVSAMWKKQGGLHVGTPWPMECHLVGKDGIVPDFVAPKSFVNGHDWAAVGVKFIVRNEAEKPEQYIICKSWQGPNFGDKGYCYFDRMQIDNLLSVTGAGSFGQAHATAEDIKLVKMTLIETLISKLQLLLEKLLTAHLDSVPDLPPTPPVQAPQPQPAPIETPKYAWGTPELAKHSIRVICDEEGLTVEQKTTLCGTIGAESGWKTDVVHPNYIYTGGIRKVASTDYGICQWNDYYHQNEITPDEAIHNPEKAVRLMCAYWKRGQRSLWVGYSSGNYKNHI